MKQEVKTGQTDYTTMVVIRDTAGAPKTALTFESAGLDVCYTRVETDNDVVLTDGAPATLANLTAAHSDWGFLLVDDTKAPGLYRLDIADGVFASGAWSAVVSIIGTGLTPTHLEFVLVPEAPVTGVVTASLVANAITATAIADDAITAAKLNTGAITADAFAADAIVAATLATGVLTDDAFAANAITNAAVSDDVDVNVKTITAGAITAAAIATGAIDADAIASDAIAAAKIATGALTLAKFAADVGTTALATNPVAQAAGKGAWNSLRADHTTADTFGDIDTSNDLADAILDRDMSTGADNGSATVRTVRQALRALRNKWSISGTTLTVTKENDSTASWTAEITTSGSAEPITAVDPASS